MAKHDEKEQWHRSIWCTCPKPSSVTKAKYGYCEPVACCEQCWRQSSTLGACEKEVCRYAPHE
eukprot:4639237-Prymnesium_polylepis.1